MEKELLLSSIELDEAKSRLKYEGIMELVTSALIIAMYFIMGVTSYRYFFLLLLPLGYLGIVSIPYCHLKHIFKTKASSFVSYTVTLDNDTLVRNSRGVKFIYTLIDSDKSEHAITSRNFTEDVGALLLGSTVEVAYYPKNKKAYIIRKIK